MNTTVPKSQTKLHELIAAAQDTMEIERLKLRIECEKLKIEHYKNYLMPLINTVPLVAAALTLVFGAGQCSSTKSDKKELLRLIYEKNAQKADVIKAWNNLFPEQQWIDERGELIKQTK